MAYYNPPRRTRTSFRSPQPEAHQGWTLPTLSHPCCGDRFAKRPGSCRGGGCVQLCIPRLCIKQSLGCSTGAWGLSQMTIFFFYHQMTRFFGYRRNGWSLSKSRLGSSYLHRSSRKPLTAQPFVPPLEFPTNSNGFRKVQLRHSTPGKRCWTRHCAPASASRDPIRNRKLETGNLALSA